MGRQGADQTLTTGREIMRILAVILLAILLGCGDPPPKEKYSNGDTVTHRLDGRKGIVIGTKYVGAKGWAYEVRFKAPVAQQLALKATSAQWLYEFELDPCLEK